MGDSANCYCQNIFIFTARQKQGLPNKIIPVAYDRYISIHAVENTQLSAWLNKCLFPLPPLPLFIFIRYVNSKITHSWLKQFS